MKRRNNLGNIFYLIIGLIVGTAITLPIKYPEIRERAVQAWSDAQSTGREIETSLNLALMTLPESNADHGDGINEVILGIYDEEYEYVAGFYGESKLFELTTYDRRHTSFKCWWSTDLASDMTELHNHPLSGYSFSYADLNDLCKNQLFGRAIAVDCDGAVYILTAPDGWPTPKELKSFFETYLGIDFTSDTLIAPTVLDTLERKGFILVRREGSMVYIGLTSRTISEFAKNFGLIYSVGSLPTEE